MESYRVIDLDVERLDTVDNPSWEITSVLDPVKRTLQEADLDTSARLREQVYEVHAWIKKKGVGTMAELAALEMLRRAERRTAQMILLAQEQGLIRKHGHAGQDHMRSSSDYIADSYTRRDARIMAEASDEEFERALDLAREDRDFGRNHLLRQLQIVRPGSRGPAPYKHRKEPREGVKQPPKNVTQSEIQEIRRMAQAGATTRQIAASLGRIEYTIRNTAKNLGIEVHADKMVGNVRRLDHNRVVQQTALTLDGLRSTTAVVDVDLVDPATVELWLDSMKQSVRRINQFIKELANANSNSI